MVFCQQDSVCGVCVCEDMCDTVRECVCMWGILCGMFIGVLYMWVSGVCVCCIVVQVAHVV